MSLIEKTLSAVQFREVVLSHARDAGEDEQ